MAAEKQGKLSQALRRLLMKRVGVVAAERITDHFYLITLAGASLEGVACVLGQKLQIAIGSGLATRTYTPIDCDTSAGRMRLLGYAHGNGPREPLVAEREARDTCDVFGPRSSLDLGRLAGPVALFGDETAIGLGSSIAGAVGPGGIACHFEVTDPAGSGDVLRRMGLNDAVLYRRAIDDAHLARMEAVIPEIAASGAFFILAGKGASVQRFRQSLKQCAVPAAQIATKAYWAAGKVGLD